ncbi:MAG: host attachment protein [Rickettsiales bacterium]|nr:host attachment protein [Rickettsiales bacterium]
MRQKKTITWIAAIDGKHAHFYTKDESHRLGNLNHTLTAQPIRTDEPTGRHELGRVHDRVGGGGRHIVEPHTSDRTLERKAFMREVAKYLDKALARGEYNRLVVAAPPKILGFLREALSKPVKDVIALELDKDLMQLTPAQVQKKKKKVVYV